MRIYLSNFVSQCHLSLDLLLDNRCERIRLEDYVVKAGKHSPPPSHQHFATNTHTFKQKVNMASYLVTGSSRGLGLALISRLASLPKADVGTIIATARSENSPRLNELVSASPGRIELVELDVTDKPSVEAAARLVEAKLQGKGLDYLVNNAGIMDWSPTGLEGM